MARPVTILRDHGRGEWKLITAMPHVALRPHVARYTGWFERRATPLQRREIPSHIPLIINFGSPIRVDRLVVVRSRVEPAAIHRPLQEARRPGP